jgi:GTP-binding protein Era
MSVVRASLEQCDLILLVADAARRFEEEDRRVLDLARKPNGPVALVLNKIDLLKDKRRLLPLMERYRSLHDFAEYVPVSALTGDGIDLLGRVIAGRLPEGPAYFPEDYVTDQPERFLAAELVREQAVRATYGEAPHAIGVTVDRWEAEPRITRIYATIRVERPGQKAILIGAGGAMLGKIGARARAEMEKLFGARIYLDLHVRVQPGWRQQRAYLDGLDWRTIAGDNDS